ncbi:Zn-dependent alcohol dehydrogenase [Parafrankia sp. EUN1f]|uniref:zinc-binding dehydrogenase n=1 Tax=Parafrankia sp. EUN1f TaxID=102897 RepID=UPI0001C46783|nr:Zn-dependent alcohol dehydrogenase [Parafrankia sp. EUN1f]EFC81268.1 Alcohol dehydrogenase GroES domain protein [Parafrankia sp. EUN1f]
MQALVYDPDQPAGLRLAEAAEPVLAPDQALVEVRAISLNFGELAYRTGRAQPGQVHGWDAAGVVVAATEDGSGPATGTPVVTFGWTVPGRAAAPCPRRRWRRGAGLGRLGATEIVIGLADVTGSVYGVLDNVGGQQLADAFSLLERGGVALSIGKASGQPTTIDLERERHRSSGQRIEPFAMGSGLAEDLGYLVRLLDQGQLDPQIGWRGSWERAPEAAEALLSRRVAGKAVLDLPA